MGADEKGRKCIEGTKVYLEGQLAVVYIYLDEKPIIVGSAKPENGLQKTPNVLEENDQVEALIANRFSYKAIINNMYLGLIYQNEI